MNCHLTPVRMTVIKRQEINADKDENKLEHLCIVSGNVNWCSHYGKYYGDSSKNLK